jgi:hypothetical protein
MLITTEEAAVYLRLEPEDLTPMENEEINGFIAAAEASLYKATGIVYERDNALAVLYCRMLVCHWYDNRGLAGEISDAARGILTQLKYCAEKQ